MTPDDDDGTPRKQLAAGRGHPSSLVVDASRIAWIEDLASVDTVPLAGGSVATVVSYPASAVDWSTAEYLALYDGDVYWTGIHGCTSSTDCPGYRPFASVASSGGGPARELYSGEPTSSWSNLLVDANGVVIVQGSTSTQTSPSAVLLRIPATGEAPTELDAEDAQAFSDGSLAPCSVGVCWFGRVVVDGGMALAFDRVPASGAAQRSTLPPAVNPFEDVFLAMDGERVYFLEANFDVYTAPVVSLRSIATSGESLRIYGRPSVTAGTSPLAFDAQSLYYGAADGIHVMPK